MVTYCSPVHDWNRTCYICVLLLSRWLIKGIHGIQTSIDCNSIVTTCFSLKSLSTGPLI